MKSISDMLGEAQSALNEAQKKRRFKKANQELADKVALQEALMKCRGKLEICKNDLNRTIRNQSRNITNGRNIGADTLLQEQILWDAAIGYMLVKDAIYGLETVNSYDSISHAYEMLDAAMKQMTGRKGGSPGHLKNGAEKERNIYGYITSSAALREKEGLLESFFETLKVSGNIEGCLAGAQAPAERQAELRHAYAGGGNPAAISDMEERMKRLNDVKNAPARTEDFTGGLDSMMDIHPPKG